jgi:hypothetical protein
MLRDMPDAQARVSQAEALVRSARLFLFDSLDQLWTKLLETGQAAMAALAFSRGWPRRMPLTARRRPSI